MIIHRRYSQPHLSLIFVLQRWERIPHSVLITVSPFPPLLIWNFEPMTFKLHGQKRTTGLEQQDVHLSLALRVYISAMTLVRTGILWISLALWVIKVSSHYMWPTSALPVRTSAYFKSLRTHIFYHREILLMFIILGDRVKGKIALQSLPITMCTFQSSPDFPRQ